MVIRYQSRITTYLLLENSNWTCWLGKSFLKHPSVFSRGFFEFDSSLTSNVLNWYTDASTLYGMGGICGSQWFIADWPEAFMKFCQPSINYLELLALTTGVLLWIHAYRNQNVTIFCDNQSIVHMINSTSSTCCNCMSLIRIIVLQCMFFNVKLTVKHVLGVKNIFADFLSPHKYKEFWKFARSKGVKFDKRPRTIPEELWPPQKLWSWSQNAEKKPKLAKLS